jgi:nucleoid DNA-binding protein
MTKIELIKKIHINHKEMTQKVITDLLNTVFEVMKKDIYTNNKFTYPGFGTFLVKERKERMGRNPKTGDKIVIKSSRTVSFKPAKLFKKEINE